MNELIVNLHMHTIYSDGEGTHADIIKAAQHAEIDVVIVTDHNTLVSGIEQYYDLPDRKGLMLVGEEIHDQSRIPQKSHLLVLNVPKEMATLAGDPQTLIERVNKEGGLSFLAHPQDPELKLFHEDGISWEDWQATGFTGFEIWNNFSEFKGRIKNKLSALFLAFNPQYITEQPYAEVLTKWDELLSEGRKTVIVGGSDAHALKLHLGPIKRIVFPYEIHFQSINTHIQVPGSLTGDLVKDKKMIYSALKSGNAFVGYDLPASTEGFQFTAQSGTSKTSIGEEIVLEGGVTFQISTPENGTIHLLKDGKHIKNWNNTRFCTYITSEPGIYRVEVHIDFLGKQRGWIFSNPIFVKKPQYLE